MKLLSSVFIVEHKGHQYTAKWEDKINGCAVVCLEDENNLPYVVSVYDHYSIMTVSTNQKANPTNAKRYVAKFLNQAKKAALTI